MSSRFHLIADNDPRAVRVAYWSGDDGQTHFYDGAWLGWDDFTDWLRCGRFSRAVRPLDWEGVWLWRFAGWHHQTLPAPTP